MIESEIGEDMGELPLSPHPLRILRAVAGEWPTGQMVSVRLAVALVAGREQEEGLGPYLR